MCSATTGLLTQNTRRKHEHTQRHTTHTTTHYAHNDKQQGYKLVDALSPSPDHPTLHQLNGRNALLSKLGGLPSAWYLADVSVNAAGALRVSGATAVDASGVGGLWLTRSGSVTPWGTHLGGEESPVDCRAYEETFLQQGGSGTGSGGGGGGCVAGRRAAATMCGMAERSPRDGRRLSRFARYFGAYEGAARRHPSLAHLDLFESPEALSAFVSAFKCYNCERMREVGREEGRLGEREGDRQGERERLGGRGRLQCKCF